MEFRALSFDELDCWAEHCRSVFRGAGHDVDKPYFLRHYHDDPWRDIGGIFVAADGGEIVSTVRLFRRTVWLLGAEVPAGGIGEVSTKPEYRGNGLAGTLLEMAAEKMRRDGMAVSHLFSMSHDFYRRFGWEVLPKPMARYAPASALPCEGRAIRKEDLPKLMAVEAASGKTDWMAVRAEKEYWESWINASLGKGVVAVDGGDIVAWLAYRPGEDVWHATEFRALPGYEHKFDGLCALAAALEGRLKQIFTAPAWLPSGTEPEEKFNEMHTMARLVSPFTAGGITMDTTQKLLQTAGECRDSELDHF
jgi:GNAT superfamily N-acetyltransferase